MEHLKNIKIICICGYNNSGKTTVGQMVAEKLRYNFIEMSSIVQQFSKNGGLSAINTPEILDVLVQHLKDNSVISGIRESYIIKHLRENFDTVVFWLERENRSPNVTKEENDILIGINDVKSTYDFKIRNNGNVEEACDKIINKSK